MDQIRIIFNAKIGYDVIFGGYLSAKCGGWHNLIHSTESQNNATSGVVRFPWLNGLSAKVSGLSLANFLYDTVSMQEFFNSGHALKYWKYTELEVFNYKVVTP